MSILPSIHFGCWIYFVCDAVATIGPGLPSTILHIRIVVNAIDLPTLFAVAWTWSQANSCGCSGEESTVRQCFNV